MELVGCGCMGFSFTQKYKVAIIKLYEQLLDFGDIGIIDYQDFQKIIAKKGVSDESEIRMLVPFLLKAGIINTDKCIKNYTGSRITKIIIDEGFFTAEGQEFVNVLKLEINKDNTVNKEIKMKIEEIYHKAGMIVFINLCKSGEYIYKEIFRFLKKYRTIDKNEFYLLTDCFENEKKNNLDEMVYKYRHGMIKHIKIIKNVNDWQYLIGILLQFGIVVQNEEKKIMLTNDVYELEVL